MKLSLLAITTTAATMMPQGVLSHDKLRGAQPIASDAQVAKQYQYEEASIEQEDMDTLVNGFCGAVLDISDAFWSNGGKHHTEDDAYPQEACDAAYAEAMAALNGAYNYPGKSSVIWLLCLTFICLY